MNKPLQLRLMQERLAICKLPCDASFPDWMDVDQFYSLTRSSNELSVVCSEACVPEGIKAETDWRILKVVGPLDFELTGVIASLATPLAEAGIPVFVISSYDTDYLMVKSRKLIEAVQILSASHTIET